MKTRLNLDGILPQKLSWNSGTLTWMFKWDSWTCPKCPLTVKDRNSPFVTELWRVDLLFFPVISCLIHVLTCVTICHTSSMGKEPVPFARPFFTSIGMSATSSLVSYTAQGPTIPSTDVLQSHTTVVLVCCTIKWEPDITCTYEIEYSKVLEMYHIYIYNLHLLTMLQSIKICKYNTHCWYCVRPRVLNQGAYGKG